jgi:hypothetical protein
MLLSCLHVVFLQFETKKMSFHDTEERPLKLFNKCALRIIETRKILSGTETGYYSLREASTLTYSYGAMLV